MNKKAIYAPIPDGMIKPMTPEERRLDELFDEYHGYEMGADTAETLRRICLDLIRKEMAK